MIYRADNWIYRDSIAAYWRMTGSVNKVDIPFTDLPLYFIAPSAGERHGGRFARPP